MAEKFNKETPFEVALVEALRRKGWGQQPVLMYPTEADPGSGLFPVPGPVRPA